MLDITCMRQIRLINYSDVITGYLVIKAHSTNQSADFPIEMLCDCSVMHRLCATVDLVLIHQSSD